MKAPSYGSQQREWRITQTHKLTMDSAGYHLHELMAPKDADKIRIGERLPITAVLSTSRKASRNTFCVTVDSQTWTRRFARLST